MTSDTFRGLFVPVDGVCLAQKVERLVEFVAGDLAAVDVEPGEERPVEDALDGLILAGSDVHGVRVVEQVKGSEEHLSAGLQLAGGSLKLPGELGLFLADSGQLDPDLVLRPAFLSGQVEEVALLGVELLKLLGEGCAHVVAQFKVLGDCFLDAAAHGCPQLWRQDDGVGVVLLNGPFHHVYGDVGLIAALLLTASAEEVEVLAAVAPARHDREAVLAASAPDQSLEEVQVFAFAGAAASVGVKDALHAVEQLFVDERFMPSLILNAVDRGLADVVAVAQHAPERFPAYRRRTAGSGKPGVAHDLVQAVEGVQAGAEQLECSGDERCTLLVDEDGVDLVAVDVDAGVGVADLGAGDGAAVLDLVVHLGGDVLAAELDLDFVHDVGDGFHGVGHDALAELLFG